MPIPEETLQVIREAADAAAWCNDFAAHAPLVLALIAAYREQGTALAARDAETTTLRAALEWSGENARLCRLIHSGGDV